eukprot:SAG11_NODE_198_length_12679_cov_7.778537_4_plen_101_part_00
MAAKCCGDSGDRELPSWPTRRAQADAALTSAGMKLELVQHSTAPFQRGRALHSSAAAPQGTVRLPPADVLARRVQCSLKHACMHAGPDVRVACGARGHAW